MPGHFYAWILWVAAVGVFGLYLTTVLSGKNASLVMPGDSTHGHYQIELACDACHTKGTGVDQQSCLRCHAEELKRVDDSHPIVKFKDPRNADRLEFIDARRCVSCHREHQPEQTGTMGLSLPEDYCFFCHQEIGEQRPTHANLGYETCATAGCHNYHDNSSLYEKFLVTHLDEPDFRAHPVVPGRGEIGGGNRGVDGVLRERIEMERADMPEGTEFTRELLQGWRDTAHAEAGINCTACHNRADEATGSVGWVDRPDHTSCGACHAEEVKGFLESRHGMRLANGFSPMTPGMARLPMHGGSAHRELSCVSCHASHRFDTRRAAVQACAGCHDDEHTRAYFGSPHYQTWLSEQRGSAGAGTGVSCATCHLPRVERVEFGETRTVVDHNQNNSLRPNEKMIRSACMHCHGLQFSINALADPALIHRNFSGRPARFVKSLEMAREERLRAERKEEEEESRRSE